MKIHNPILVNWTQQLPETFYGINVEESDGSPRYRGIRTITFDRTNFYIGQNVPNTDNVLISFRSTEASGIDIASSIKNYLSPRKLTFNSSDFYLTPDSLGRPVASLSNAPGVIFKESEYGGYSRRSDLLSFDSNDFYLSNNNQGKPLVSFTRPVREILTSDRTYFVRTDGSDNNTGRVNSAGGAFLTLAKAISVVGTLDLSIYAVTIKLGIAGTYAGTGVVNTGFVGGAGSSVTIEGDTTNPGAYILSTQSTFSNSCFISIKGVDFTSNGAGIVSQFNSLVSITGPVIFGACTGAHMQAQNDGIINGGAQSFTIDGGATRHLFAQSRGALLFTSSTITVSGTPAFSTAFANSTELGFIRASGSTYTGGATGQRYNAALNSVINTGGGGANFFPGDVAGATATGAQYA